MLRNREKEIVEKLKNIEIPEEKQEEFKKVASEFCKWADNQELVDFVREKTGLAPINKEDLPL